MNVEEYRGWFIAGSLVLMLAAATPTLALFIRLPSGSEKFSELWLLGSRHEAEDYPFNITVNENYKVYVGIGNRLGYSAYYRVYVKFRNQTQPLPVASNSTPSPLPALYEFNFFVKDSEIWEAPLNFKVLEITSSNDSMTVGSLSINDVTFLVNSLSAWDTERNGFYYQLFFELWSYNTTLQGFQYHNRYVRIWLNVTRGI